MRLLLGNFSLLVLKCIQVCTEWIPDEGDTGGMGQWRPFIQICFNLQPDQIYISVRILSPGREFGMIRKSSDVIPQHFRVLSSGELRDRSIQMERP